MSELRWWLLILGVAFFAGLTVFELRRPRQARQDEAPPEATRPPREPSLARPEEAEHAESLQLPEIHAVESLAGRPLPVVELAAAEADFPVLEAASPPEEAFTELPTEVPTELPTELPAEAPAETPDPASQEAEPPPAAQPAGPRDLLPELPPARAPVVEWPPDEERRIMALRLVAPEPERFAGRSVRQALAAEGFVLGRFDIFHKPDETQRAVLSAASLTRPGTFDAETMDSQRFGGLSLFAVLPGPMPPPEAFEALVATARNLNDRLRGVLQDDGGTPLTPARLASLRQRLADGAPS